MVESSLVNKKAHLLPNAITAFGLTCGLFVIFKMNMVDPGKGNDQVIYQMAAVLLLAAFADLLDGAVARAMKVETDFGGLFDSLADAISFGVAPAVVVLKTLSVEPGTPLSFFATAGAMIYTVSGVLRLVRFNMSRLDAPKEESHFDHRRFFMGLPIPAAAALLVSTDLMLVSQEFMEWFPISHLERSLYLTGLMFLLGYLMVSRLKFPSFKALNARISSYRLLLLTVLFAAFILYGLLTHFSFVFFTLSWLYVFNALFLSLYRYLSPAREDLGL
ncbi:MAG: hypothetical protein K0S07_478 [Chlamydiales bacterium]|jgi:CDP-diacylglycerol--serine O-phosphatidyltransferase|nr:hypothetical protein [Chlamydiales bacterium]